MGDPREGGLAFAGVERAIGPRSTLFGFLSGTVTGRCEEHFPRPPSYVVAVSTTPRQHRRRRCFEGRPPSETVQRRCRRPSPQNGSREKISADRCFSAASGEQPLRNFFPQRRASGTDERNAHRRGLFVSRRSTSTSFGRPRPSVEERGGAAHEGGGLQKRAPSPLRSKRRWVAPCHRTFLGGGGDTRGTGTTARAGRPPLFLNRISALE